MMEIQHLHWLNVSLDLPAQSQTRNSRQSDTNHSVRGGQMQSPGSSSFLTTSTLLDDDLSDDPPVLGVGRGVAVGLADRRVLQLQEEGMFCLIRNFLKYDLTPR